MRNVASNRYLLFSFLLLLGLGSIVQAEEFDRAAEREKALAWITYPPIPELKVEGLPGSEKANEFLKYLANTWIGHANRIHRLNIQWYVYLVSLDRALYNDEAERELWEQKVTELKKARNDVIASPEFRKATQRLVELAQGLEGPVVELARRYWETMSRFEHTADDKQLTDQEAELDKAVQRIANSAPVAPKLADNDKQRLEIQRRYYSGEITLVDAAGELEAIAHESLLKKGEWVATEGLRFHNEVALVRSALAKRRGFATHADFMLAQKERYFSPGMKTPAERIKALEELLEKTKPLAEKLLRHLHGQKNGLPPFEKMNTIELSLLLPETDSMVSAYFPKEKVNDFWREFFIENGFPEDQFRDLVLDSFPREGKQTHAYMAAQSLRKPRVFKINGKDLSVIKPPEGVDHWFPSMITIVQNVRADKADYYSTVAHECGHFWAYANYDFLDGPFMLIDNEGDRVEATPWSETPSMAMEKVMSDRTFMLAKLKDAKGEPIAESLLDTYLTNVQIHEIMQLRRMMAGALFDYKLWSYDFGKPNAETFVDRSVRLSKEIHQKYFFGNTPDYRGVDPSFSRFATGHFYGGSVKYDYFYAELTARQVHARMMDLLEQTTGRRTYLKQPTMGPILIGGLYRNTHTKPYPEGVEQFTQRKLDVAGVVTMLEEEVERVTAGQASSTPAHGGCPEQVKKSGS